MLIRFFDRVLAQSQILLHTRRTQHGKLLDLFVLFDVNLRLEVDGLATSILYAYLFYHELIVFCL